MSNLNPIIRRIERFAKNYECDIFVEKRNNFLYTEIIGKYGEVRGLFKSPRDLSSFLYKISKERWRSKYYEGNL